MLHSYGLHSLSLLMQVPTNSVPLWEWECKFYLALKKGSFPSGGSWSELGTLLLTFEMPLLFQMLYLCKLKMCI